MTDDQTLLDLAGKADKELFELAEAAIKEAPGEWTRDFQKSEGEYGSGPDAHTGFNVPVLYAGEKQLLTADASDIALINEEWDEDGVTAWDEASTRVVDYLAAASPSRIQSLLSEKAELEREVEDLKSSVIAFAGPRAAQYAQEYGLPDRHLYAPHYDLLERCGARMDSFTRNPPRAALNKDPDQ